MKSTALILSLGLFAVSAPALASEDLATVQPNAVGLSFSRLEQMELSIRAGDFKDVTSVVLARDGKIAFERYFDGQGQEALRNTRSATKSITGMLVGIAVDRGLIPGVQAHVMDYFHDKQPLENPDPRKSQLTIEDF